MTSVGSGWQHVLAPAALALAPVLLVLGAGLLALATWVAILVLRRHEARSVEQALRSERERLAREVHDGPAQELAALVRHARSRSPAGECAVEVEQLATAAERAMTHLRLQMHALERRPSRLGVALAEEASTLLVHDDVALEIDVGVDVDVGRERQHALLCVAREALTNAVAHGGAGWIGVRLERAVAGLELSIADDGSGFDPAAARRHRGLGLASMAWRARRAGGRLHVDSRPGVGTIVRVTL